MAGNRPEERVRRVALAQSWRHVAFLHWRVEPPSLRGLLPPEVEPDIVDGSAWVGVVLFQVERVRVLGVVPVPSMMSFPETNVRTYVRDADGRDGLWFLSLDVGSTVNAV